MLEFGVDKSSAGDLIKDVNEDTFMADVIDASQDVPVIVDFWAVSYTHLTLPTKRIV